MSKNKYDVVQYCLRLNLNNPEHLEVHKILQNLNKDVHKSQTAFIIKAILEMAAKFDDEELLSEAAALKKQKEKFITKAEFEECKEELRKEMLQEITALLISSIAKNGVSVNTTPNNVSSDDDEEIETDVDETLIGLSKSWA